jgi:hypothetical protein
VAGRQQPRAHVQPVTAIGHRHGIEQRARLARQKPMRQRNLIGFDSRPHVSDELGDPMHR